MVHGLILYSLPRYTLVSLVRRWSGIPTRLRLLTGKTLQKVTYHHGVVAIEQNMVIA